MVEVVYRYGRLYKVQKWLSRWAVIMLSAMLVACGGSSAGNSAEPLPPAVVQPPENPTVLAINALWDDTVSAYLQQDLWAPSNMYDAGLVLMLPLEYAFQIQPNQAMQDDFHDFYARFLPEFDASLDTNDLSRFQFYYVLVRYLAFTQQAGWDQEQQLLYDKLLDDFDYIWFEEHLTSRFGGEVNRSEILQQKLNNIGNSSPKYVRATVDLEFFGFAIAAEIAAIQRMAGQEVSVTVQHMLDLAVATFRQEVTATAAGWLYQPGQWDDYIDTMYAGHDILATDLEPAPVPGIATDSSHSHRMPLWLVSLASGFDAGSEERAYFESLRDGFQSQFMEVVYVAPSDDFPGPRMTNYMDGHNGIYRYRYHDNTDLKLGYDAYNLSGTLLVGYYPFMKNTQLANAYAELSFPLSDAILESYLGLLGQGGTPDRTRAFILTDYYQFGQAELYALIASLMSEEG